MWKNKPIPPSISDMGLTDDELEDNICIKCDGGGWQINKGEIKINI